jgi:hypothetical protein
VWGDWREEVVGLTEEAARKMEEKEIGVEEVMRGRGVVGGEGKALRKWLGMPFAASTSSTLFSSGSSDFSFSLSPSPSSSRSSISSFSLSTSSSFLFSSSYLSSSSS